MMNGSNYSLSDIAAATGSNNRAMICGAVMAFHLSGSS